MAIPIGTTSCQLGWIARWLLVAMVIVGMLVWWWPSYRSWGALAAGILVTFLLWLMWKTVSCDRSVAGHPFYLVLLVPTVILTVHFVRTGLATDSIGSGVLQGGLNLSMLFQIFLLAAGVMLTQSLLPRAASHTVVLSLCGAAMMGGAVAATVWGRAEEVRDALAMVGLAGVGVWLSPLWGLGGQDDPQQLSHPLRRRDMSIACIGVAVIATAMFGRFSPRATLTAAVIVGLVLVLGGIIFRRGRKTSLAAGGVLVTTAMLSLTYTGSVFHLSEIASASWFGSGEGAFSSLFAGDSGLAVMLSMVGWVGTFCLVGGMIACTVWLMGHCRRERSEDQGRAIVWTAATAMASCAMLSSGGLFIPVVTLAGAFVWGLFPAMLSCKSRPRIGVMLLPVVLFMMILLGLARQQGLALWAVNIFGYEDKLLHGMTGLILAMSLAWLIGAKKWWLGLLAIAAAALVGGAGELLQRIATTWRGPELADWAAHAVGSAIALIPYLLCISSRWCESPDAVTTVGRRA